MAPKEPEVRAVQQEAPKESEAGGAHQEAPEGSSSDEGEDGDGQPQVNYRLVQFYFSLDDFLYKVTNLNSAGCNALS
jgi:hypothetical protein